MRIIGNRGNTARKLQAVASGALPNGDTIVVNADGTVSVVAEQASGVGTAVVFESGATSNVGVAFDSSNNKIVIAYKDGGNSNQGTAIVGTVDSSDNSISFGTAAVFETGNLSEMYQIAFDSNSNRVVIAYSDGGNSNYGTAIVGTVSGTSISFGTAVVFESAYSAYINTVFDSNSNKAVIAYQDYGDSQKGKAVVGTVSGTSISFGSIATFANAATGFISSSFDSSNNKVVIAYQDDDNSNYGTAIVGTVSGTSISFGSEVVFEAARTYDTSCTFDSSSNKIIIAYTDQDSAGSNTRYGTAIVGTVSGTSISFGTAVVFQSARAEGITALFDSNSNKVVIGYRDAANSSKPTAIVGTVSGTSISFGSEVLLLDAAMGDKVGGVFDSNSNRIVFALRNTGDDTGNSVVYAPVASTNLTAENYIGIASNGYASGQAATINAKGFIDDNQSSLTAGQSYFVQTNGDLGTTAANPSVFAGTAVSATKLIVKG